MHTEAEAKCLWCPFARDLQHNGGNRMAYGGNAEPDNDDCAAQFAAEMADLHPCIASACMAWRWRTEEVHGSMATTKRERGYCGLAGKPVQ